MFLSFCNILVLKSRVLKVDKDWKAVLMKAIELIKQIQNFEQFASELAHCVYQQMF